MALVFPFNTHNNSIRQKNKKDIFFPYLSYDGTSVSEIGIMQVLI